MSSDCIYKEFAVKVPAEKVGMDADQYLLISQAGSNNCYDLPRGNRHALGACPAWVRKEDIIATAIYVAGGFESGGLYFGNFGASGSHQSPVFHIAKVRRMINGAGDAESLTINYGQSRCGSRTKAENCWIGKLLPVPCTSTKPTIVHDGRNNSKWPNKLGGKFMIVAYPVGREPDLLIGNRLYYASVLFP